MNYRLTKVIVSFLLVVALLGSVGIFNNSSRVEADTVSSATKKSDAVIIVKPPSENNVPDKKPVEVVNIITNSYLTLVIDADKDYIVSLDNQWMISEVTLLGETNENMNLYNGLTLTQFIEKIKFKLDTQTSFYKPVSPIVFGFDPDSISLDELNLLKATIASHFISSPVMLLGIHEDDLPIIKENALNQFYLAHLEEILRIKTLIEPQYLFVTQSPIFMNALENLSSVMMYKGSDDLSFSEDGKVLLKLEAHDELTYKDPISIVEKPIYRYDDDEDDEEEDDDDDEEDDDDDDEYDD